MIELLFLELALAPDPIHDLELTLLGLSDIGDEVEEVVRLVVEPERVEGPEHERRVANPAVAIVPVAVPARALGQRCGRGRDHRSRWTEGQALQGERTALQVRAPPVIRKRAMLEPFL